MGDFSDCPRVDRKRNRDFQGAAQKRVFKHFHVPHPLLMQLVVGLIVTLNQFHNPSHNGWMNE